MRGNRTLGVLLGILALCFFCAALNVRTITYLLHFTYGWFIRPWATWGILIGLAACFVLFCSAYDFDVFFTNLNSRGRIVVAVVVSMILLWSPFNIWDSYGKAVGFSFEPERVGDQIPDIRGIRYLPFDVAKKTHNNAHTDPTTLTGDLDPILEGDEVKWIAPSVANGWGNNFQLGTIGIQIVGDDLKYEFQPQQFACTEVGWFKNDTAWYFVQKKWAAYYDEVAYFKYQGQWYAYAPYWEFRFEFPNAIPYWGGVMIMDSNCKVIDLSPSEAAVDPRIPANQMLYPWRLMKEQVSNWGYRSGGLQNVLFFNRDNISIPGSPGENDFPYLLSTSWGPQLFLPVKPSGSQSVTKIFWVDAHTGKWRLTDFGSKSLVGPEAGIGHLKSAVTEITSWQNYQILEPRPLPAKGKLYWLYSVTPTEKSNVVFSALVNTADPKEVLVFCNKNSLVAWIEGKGNPQSANKCDLERIQ